MTIYRGDRLAMEPCPSMLGERLAAESGVGASRTVFF